MDKKILLNLLAEFFLDSLREDGADVGNWCLQSEEPVDAIVDAIAIYTARTL